MRIRLLGFFSILGVLILTGCGGGGGSSEGGGACGAFNARVFNGETCNQAASSPVVAIFPVAFDGQQIQIAGICTGTLVTVDDILTSAHCFTGPIAQQGNSLVDFAVVVGGVNGEVRYVVNLAIHPFYNGQAGSPYDIAMVTLDRVPTPPIGPVPILVSRLTQVGERASTFGYGTNNTGEVGTLKSAELTISAFSGGNIFVSTEGSGAAICQGDSGGPLVQNVNGVTSIIGVNSFGDVSAEQCALTGGSYSGFVDLQNIDILDFIVGYAPDVAAN